MGNAAAAQLMRRAHAELDEIGAGADPRTTFLFAHMGALRAAAALVALAPTGSARPGRRRAVRSVWEQLAELGSEWESWAGFFAGGAPIRAAIDSDRDVDLSDEHVERTLAAATDFIALVGEQVRAADARTFAGVSALAS